MFVDNYSKIIIVLTFVLLVGSGYFGFKSSNNLTEVGEKKLQNSFIHRTGFNKSNYTKIGLKFANISLGLGIAAILMFVLFIISLIINS